MLSEFSFAFFSNKRRRNSCRWIPNFPMEMETAVVSMESEQKISFLIGWSLTTVRPVESFLLEGV